MLTQTNIPGQQEAAEAPAVPRFGESSTLWFYTRGGQSVNLGGWYAGRACFLICGGPSLKDMNLGLLNTPGVVTWGVNNSWAVHRPRLWTCLDPAGRFHDRGWRDPSICKIVPQGHARQHLRYKRGADFHPSRLRVCDCPNVLYFPAKSGFEPADFLVEPAVCCGNPESQTDSLGCRGIRSVMLATVRLVHALGFRTLYILGADFRMEPGEAYAFEQERDRRTCQHNARLFGVLNERFAALVPYFEAEGFQLWNCTPNSGLTAFPFKRLSEAVEEATRDCAAPMDTSDWYSGPKPDPFEPYRHHGNGD